MKLFLYLLMILMTGCSDEDVHHPEIPRTIKSEYITRTHDEHLFSPPPPEKVALPIYSWEKYHDKHPRITKEYFRCKGSSLNPVKVVQVNGETVRYEDCGGAEKHSLPLKDQKEFIYPILIDLLNDIQDRTEKRVVITSGHRCPEHNSYVDHNKYNNYSKHTIGAEVTFYVQGFEQTPIAIIDLIQDYYKKNTKYGNAKEYTEFQRWDKPLVDVSTPAWYNKEIFIKLYQKQEGRNFDNRHPYPYISIQVRFDTELNERVNYSWDKAFKNYLRW